MATEGEDGRWDFLEWLGRDLSALVLGSLDDPADVVRASAVSRLWRHFAYFQPGRPIYSANTVRIRLGYSKLPPLLESSNSTDGESEVTGYSKLHYVLGSGMSAKDEAEQVADSNFIWTYVSPEFSMAQYLHFLIQENALQTFKLPRPVLSVGGVLKIDLLGRIERQHTDDLYYICITCIKVVEHLFHRF